MTLLLMISPDNSISAAQVSLTNAASQSNCIHTVGSHASSFCTVNAQIEPLPPTLEMLGSQQLHMELCRGKKPSYYPDVYYQ